MNYHEVYKHARMSGFHYDKLMHNRVRGRFKCPVAGCRWPQQASVALLRFHCLQRHSQLASMAISYKCFACGCLEKTTAGLSTHLADKHSIDVSKHLVEELLVFTDFDWLMRNSGHPRPGRITNFWRSVPLAPVLPLSNDVTTRYHVKSIAQAHIAYGDGDAGGLATGDGGDVGTLAGGDDVGTLAGGDGDVNTLAAARDDDVGTLAGGDADVGALADGDVGTLADGGVGALADSDVGTLAAGNGDGTLAAGNGDVDTLAAGDGGDVGTFAGYGVDSVHRRIDGG